MRISPRVRSFAALSALLSATGAAAAADPLACLREVAPGIRQDMRYAGSKNFTGAPVPGYAAPKCWLARPAAEALAKAQSELEARGLTLIVFDCYRPVRAVRHFVTWAETQRGRRDPVWFPNVDGGRLIAEGYIAARSGHSTGFSVDLTFGDAAGAPADTGGAFDLFDPVSRTDAAGIGTKARENRKLLVKTMAAHGFANYAAEWWHFTYRGKRGPALDVDVKACGR